MKLKYKIQKANFFSDQFEEKGEIDTDMAIEVFQSFPFEQQFEEIKSRKMTSCFPKLIFEKENNESLSIWGENEECFFLHYENRESESNFLISNIYNPDTEQFSTEDVIELFITGKIPSTLNLNSKIGINKHQETEEKQLTFHSQEKLKYKHYAWVILFLLSTLIIFRFKDNRNFDIAIYVYSFFSLYWLPSAILLITYYLKNKQVIIKIDRNSNTIYFEKNGESIIFNRDDISLCEINKTRFTRKFSHAFKYLWITLKDGRQIVITNLIVEPEIIIQLLNLHYSIDKRVIPFLPIR